MSQEEKKIIQHHCNRAALDIVEGIIESTYLSESRTESLKKKTPKKADHE